MGTRETVTILHGEGGPRSPRGVATAHTVKSWVLVLSLPRSTLGSQSLEGSCYTQLYRPPTISENRGRGNFSRSGKKLKMTKMEGQSREDLNEESCRPQINPSAVLIVEQNPSNVVNRRII